MWKISWKIAILSVAAAIVFFWVVKTELIATYLTEKIKIPVTIGQIELGLSQSQIIDFQIRNPRGFHSHFALLAANTSIAYQLTELFSSPSIIDTIEIDDVFLSIELLNPLGTQNNWTVIGENIRKKEAKERLHEVAVHTLIVRNLTVEIRGLGLSGATQVKQIPYLQFDNIDSHEGFPTKELIQAIFGGSGLMQYIQDIFNPQNLLPKALSPFQLFGMTGGLESPPNMD